MGPNLGISKIMLSNLRKDERLRRRYVTIPHTIRAKVQMILATSYLTVVPGEALSDMEVFLGRCFKMSQRQLI